jgi:crotonobetainyl-CoA:carnitine CoA-transferase CaiB-like acyl-CoA transferase
VVRTSSDALKIPALRERGMLQESRTHDGKPVTVMNAAFVADSDGPSLSGPVPGLGEHTEAVLQELGYGEAEIKRLQEQGAI